MHKDVNNSSCICFHLTHRYIAADSSDYHTVVAKDIAATPRYLVTGTGACMAANRISYSFNLSGASMTVDMACSSSMTALDLAAKTLQRGDSSIAIVAGAKLINTPDMFMPSSELGFLSAHGRCRSFDTDGDGYRRGEGVLAVLLTPLATAIADNDPIDDLLFYNHDSRDPLTSLRGDRCCVRSWSFVFARRNCYSLLPRIVFQQKRSYPIRRSVCSRSRGSSRGPHRP